MSLAIELQIQTLGNLYKSTKLYLHKLKGLKHHELIVGMDHNFDFLKSSSNSTTSKFLNLNLDNDLIPCITKPTRVTNKTATLIDNILISTKLQYNYTPLVITDDLSDSLSHPCNTKQRRKM